MASKAVGNTGIRYKLVSVCDELPRQNLVDKHIYKIKMLQLQNANNKEKLQKEIRYWRRWYLRFHRELFCENVFEKSGKTISIGNSSEKAKLQQKIFE